MRYRDGDVICYQVEMTEKEVQDLEAQSLYSSVPQFYDFLQNRVLVQFKSRFEDPTGKVPDFDLVLSKKMTYEVVSGSNAVHLILTTADGTSSRVSYLKQDPLKLRFTSSNPQSGTPKINNQTISQPKCGGHNWNELL